MRLLITYAQVIADLTGWVLHFNQQIEWIRGRNNSCSLRDLPLGQIARGLLGRPAVDPKGPTRIDVLPPLMHTDTKSHVDIFKIFAHTAMHTAKFLFNMVSRGLGCDGMYPPPSAENAIYIGFSDGQSNKLEGHSLHRNPSLARNRVPADGPMHAFAHAMFGGNEMFHSCFTAWCAKFLLREKIRSPQGNLENNALKNHQEFMSEIYVGVTTYLLQNVSNPPPELWISDPAAYISRVQHKGAKVILEYIR